MRIYLARHGQALPKDADPERPLAPAGKAEVKKVARWLKGLNLEVRAIWHSPKARARQTAEILARAVAVQTGLVERKDLAPDDDPQSVARALRRASGDVMVVGHLPMLARLAGLLLARDEEAEPLALEAGAVACLREDDAGGWRVAWLVGPSVLR